MDIPWRNWGVGMDSHVMKHLMDGCPHCGFGDRDDAPVGRDWWYFQTVGFSNSEGVFSRRGNGRGAIAIECPVCFEVSWRHSLYCSMSEFAERLERGEIELRVPGAHEAFMAVYEQAKKGVV